MNGLVWRLKPKAFRVVVQVLAAFALLWLLTALFGSALMDLVTVAVDVGKPEAMLVMAGEAEIRVTEAATLYKEGRAPLVILANDGVVKYWSREDQRNLGSVEWAARTLTLIGVPEDKVVKLPFTQSGTYFDLLHARAYAQAKGLRSLAVITSDYHTFRTFRTMGKVFEGSGISLGLWPVKTERGGLLQLRRHVAEACKMVYYELRYLKRQPEILADRTS